MDVRLRVSVLLIIIAGCISGSESVIDWTAVGSISAAVSAISSGVSMFKSPDSGYSVACTVQIENWTKYPLLFPASTINGGQLQSPPVPVQPGVKEKFIGHKTSGYATGTYGTASWLITNGEDKRAVVMWSCPYNFNFHSNWLGVGLTTTNIHEDWYNQMYYGSSGDGLNFVRGEYYYNTNTISIKNNKFEVVGTMGTSHRATARVIVRPLLEADLAEPVKTAMRKRSLLN